MTSACSPHVCKMQLYKNKSLEMFSKESNVKTAAKIFPTTLFVLLLLSRTNATSQTVPALAVVEVAGAADGLRVVHLVGLQCPENKYQNIYKNIEKTIWRQLFENHAKLLRNLSQSRSNA